MSAEMRGLAAIEAIFVALPEFPAPESRSEANALSGRTSEEAYGAWREANHGESGALTTQAILEGYAKAGALYMAASTQSPSLRRSTSLLAERDRCAEAYDRVRLHHAQDEREIHFVSTALVALSGTYLSGVSQTVSREVSERATHDEAGALAILLRAIAGRLEIRIEDEREEDRAVRKGLDRQVRDARLKHAPHVVEGGVQA